MLQNGGPMIVGGSPVTENGGVPQLASITEVNENENEEPPLTMTASSVASGAVAAASSRRRKQRNN